MKTKIFRIKIIIYIILLGLIVLGGTLLYIGDKVNKGERNAFILIKDKITSSQKEPVNLIICWTPLQMVIAERIIDLYPHEKFYTIIMSNSEKNEKFEYYSSRLSQKSERLYPFYLNSQSKELYLYTTILELKLKSLLLPEIKTIFLASIDRSEFHTIMSTFPKAQIKTFDDGTANLVSNSFYLRDEGRVVSSGEIGEFFYKTFINSTISPKKIRENYKNIILFFEIYLM